VYQIQTTKVRAGIASCPKLNSLSEIKNAGVNEIINIGIAIRRKEVSVKSE
jgi:hypothetical protein